MLVVHVLADPAVMGTVSSIMSSKVDVTLGLRTNNIREAITSPYGPDDLLVVDDQLLLASAGLLASLAEIACRKVMVGSVGDQAVARRALALESLDLIDPSRLAEELPMIVDRLMPASEVLEPWVTAVYSAKGGVGKSTVALNLAFALALQSEHPVALVDCDPLGDIGAMLWEKPGATLVDVVRGLRAGMTREKALQSLHQIKALNLTIIPAGVVPQEAADVNPGDLEEVLTMLTESHAYLVMDLATGLTDMNLAALDVASRIFVLAAPERVTLTNVQRSLNALRNLYPEKLAVLLNRADSDTGLTEEAVSSLLGLKPRYTLPSGGAAPIRAANRGRPLVLAEPKNSLARSLLAIAGEVVGAREGIRRRRRWYAR